MNVLHNDIVEGLRDSGIEAGDTVLLHCSLKSIGFVEGGADTVIDAFVEVLGEDGTLLMPSFQHGSEFFLVDRGCRFDVRTSPSEVGKVTETFRKRPNVIRSLNPTHCTAGVGKMAGKILSGHEFCPVSCGWGSPYHKICVNRGKIVLLGVGHNSNTTLHFVENVSGAPTVCPIKYKAIVVDNYGQEIEVGTYPHMPSLPRKYTKVEKLLIEAGYQTSAKVGNAECKVIKAHEMSELLCAVIRENPMFLIDAFTPSVEDY